MANAKLEKFMTSKTGILIATINVSCFDEIELTDYSDIKSWMIKKTNQKTDKNKTIELRLWNYNLYLYAKDATKYSGYSFSLFSNSPHRIGNNNFIKNTLKNTEITKFEGSLTIEDYYKLSEIVARNELKFLSDEQFFALTKFYLDEIDYVSIEKQYSKKIGSFITDKCWSAIHKLPDFELKGVINLTLIEEKVLSDLGLLEYSLIDNQCNEIAKIGEDNPYFCHFNQEYINEFIKASRNKKMSRSLINTARSELKSEDQSLFKEVFDENDDDIVIKF